jgi:peptidoglycan/xylan/chitin deacetylase (PgdA/CDA1 family)
MTGPVRDLVGYGRDIPAVEWPGKARVALSIVLNYEEGSERSFSFGDSSNEGLGEIQRHVDNEFRDLATESVYEYGSRAGGHRLLRLFDTMGVPVTVFGAAVALQRNPSIADAIREGGHEVCGHGLRWAEAWRLSPDDEARHIREAVTLIEQVCGERPVGWYDRWMPSPVTRQLLIAEGGFTYDSNAYNDDLPYYAEGRHLVLPYTLTYNDVRYVSGSTGSPSDFLDYCIRAFDYLWEEGATHPRMMSVGLHARWSGQPGRTSAVRDFLRHAADRGEVWFARRRDIADWWHSHYPPAPAPTQAGVDVQGVK